MISPSVNIQIVQKFLLFGQMICEYFLCCQTSQITRLHDHPHCGVRTAPALIGRKQPHHHNFRTFFEHYFSIFRQVYLVVQYIFLQSKKKTFLSPIFPFLRSILLSTVHFSTKQANKEKSSLKSKKSFLEIKGVFASLDRVSNYYLPI